MTGPRQYASLVSASDNDLLSLYRSGYVGGAATMLVQHGMVKDDAGALAEVFVRDMFSDPVVRFEILAGIRSAISGEMTAPTSTWSTAHMPRRGEAS